MTNSTIAAERIYISYAALERSISVAALEAYAKEGKLDEDLAAYAEYVSPQRLAQLRRVLLTEIPLTPVAVSQFLYTPIGETLMERLGQVVQTEARQPGFYALRGALILAAADPEGLTLLNVLDKFPTRSIRINLGRSLELADELERLINQTREAIALVSRQSTAAANNQRQVNFSQLPDLRRRGRFSWNKQTLKLNDHRRKREFLADIYIPNVTAPAPVIAISHGLGSDRTSFVYLAEQLASYGFAVAVPDHLGSNAEQLRSLLSGRAAEVAEPNEFINRPLDVKFLLDELQRWDSSNPSLELNLQQVGVIGQSLGGYTALALAGAALNFDQLQTDCENPNYIWNVSLLLQCRALQLPSTQYNLSDPRIKAAIAINPITSSIFGQAELSRIQLPVMIVSSSSDTIAPALPEQILPFSWLTVPEKYLVLIERATHFSIIGETEPEREAIAVPAQAIGPNPAIARRYMSALSVAFFQTYLAGNTQYRPYLSASYTQAITQAPLGISLVQSSIPIHQLNQAAR
jgi:predicted dienelactone hydrolase